MYQPTSTKKGIDEMKDNKQPAKKAINAQVSQIVAFVQTAPPIIRAGLFSFFIDAMNETQTTIVREGAEGAEIDRKGLADFLRIAASTKMDHDSGGFLTKGEGHRPLPSDTLARRIFALWADDKLPAFLQDTISDALDLASDAADVQIAGKEGDASTIEAIAQMLDALPKDYKKPLHNCINAAVSTHVAGILASDGAPVELRNAIGHAMDEIYSKLPNSKTCDAQWYLHHVLLAYQKQQEAEAAQG